MTHQLFHLPRPTAISSNLTLVAGAKVGFFLTGTSTPTNTYQDSALTTPHTNPVVADSAGRLPAIYLNPSIVYRVTFTDASDVEIYPAIDPANDQVLSQAIIDVYFSQAISNGLLYPRTTTEIAEGVTPSNYAIPSHDAIGHVLPQRYNVVGDGTTNDYAAMVIADGVAAAAGAALVLGDGTYALNTSLAFSVPVVMEGGVIAGSGTVSFPAGFSAPDYYCFDCLVGEIKAETVHAEWFGARQSTATPTSTSVNISSKAWNVWPSFITGAGWGSSHNYGDAAYLAANDPFANGDTWDFIAIQRALWAIGEVTSLRGEVRLLPAMYHLTRAVRFVGDMSTTLRGAGLTKTILTYVNINTNEVIAGSVGNFTSLIHLYGVGPDPTVIADLTCLGPNGYSFGNPTLVFPISMRVANGVTIDSCWVTIGDADIYMDSSSNDIRIWNCIFEYGSRQVYGYDTGSWCTIGNCGFWWSAGTVQQGIDIAGYAFITGCNFVSLDVPFRLGLGSHVSASTIIQRTTGLRTTIDGRTISRRLAIPPGTTYNVLTLTLEDYSALTTRMRAGGLVQGVGGVGFYRELSWYRDNAAPTAAVIQATTKFGNASAQALIAESTVTGAENLTLQIVNNGTGSQTYECDVTITVEGSDYVLEGLT